MADTTKSETVEILLKKAEEGQQTTLQLVRELEDYPRAAIAELRRLTTTGDRKKDNDLQLAVEGVADVANDRKLVIERRKLQPEQPPPLERAEALPVKHTFYDVEGFLAYLAKYGSKRIVVFADPSGPKMHGVLDETEALGGCEVVTFAPAYHPRWEPWHKAIGKKLTLDDFVCLLRNNRRSVKDGRDLLRSLAVVEMSEHTTLTRGRGRDAFNGLTVRTRIAGKAQVEDQVVELPESMVIVSPVFVGTEEVQIEVDICLEGKGGAIWVELAAADLREAEIRGFEHALEQVRAAHLEAEEGSELASMCVTYGAPSWSTWAYRDRVVNRG